MMQSDSPVNATAEAVTLVPGIGLALIGLLVVFAGGSMLLLPRARRGVVGIVFIRCVVIGGLALVLLGPSRFVAGVDESIRPLTVLMVDQSESMNTHDEMDDGERCSRYEMIRRDWLVPEMLGQLERVTDLRLIAFDERPRIESAQNLLANARFGERTHLVDSVSRVLQAATDGDSASAVSNVVLLTDGIDTEGRALAVLADQALSADLRLHAAAPGTETQLPDIAVRASMNSTLVYDGQTAELHVELRQSGYDGAPVRVSVVEAGDEDGVPIFEQTMVASPRMEWTVPIKAQRDPNIDSNVTIREYIVRAVSAPDEANLSNNERSVFLQVTGERIRVLVFEAEPYWDTKFFIQALRNDPQIDLTTVQGLGSRRYGGEEIPRLNVVRYIPDAVSSREESGLPVPTTREALWEHDVIVLGRGIETIFPAPEARHLVEFVTERGGSIIFLRGPAAGERTLAAERTRDVLAEIAPVEWGQQVLGGSRLALTDEGRRQPALAFDGVRSAETVVSSLPGMIASTRIEQEKSLSVVWLRQEQGQDASPAALAHLHVGRGRTLAVLTDGMWRWAFLPPALESYESIYQMFWSRAVRWLALGGDFLPGQSLSLAVDRMSVSPGDAVQIVVRTRQVEESRAQIKLFVHAPDGTHHELTMSEPAETRRSTFVPTDEGVYEVELLAPDLTPSRLTTRFAAYDDRVEIMDLAPRVDELRAVVERTGGRMLSDTGPAGLIELLQSEHEARQRGGRIEPAWDRAWVFLLIVGMLGAEWILRRRIGLG